MMKFPFWDGLYFKCSLHPLCFGNEVEFRECIYALPPVIILSVKMGSPKFPSTTLFLFSPEP